MFKKCKKTICIMIGALLFAQSAVSAQGIPAANCGERTIRNLLATAVEPIGSLLYVWGGGHTANGGSNTDAVTIGLGRYWQSFYNQHDGSYDYDKFRYLYRDGLDCSGYVGWVIYNTFNRTSGKTGYVMLSTSMARNFANRGWGQFTKRNKVTMLHAGDVMSTDGHVYIGIGECGDGSRVVVHCSPPAAQITGTLAPSSPEPPTTDENGNPLSDAQRAALTPEPDSEAIQLANYYMGKYWPAHHAKFPKHDRGKSYLTDYDQMTWYINGNTMSDPGGLQGMDAYHVLKALFDDDGFIMSMPTDNIIVNGTPIENKNLQYPYLMHDGMLYMPLAWNDTHALGAEVYQSPDGGGVSLLPCQSAEYVPVEGKYPVLIGEPREDVNYYGTPLHDDNYPTISYNGIIYIPLTWENMQTLGWSCQADDTSIAIDAVKDISVSVNGTPVAFNSLPFLYNGKVIVPMRDIFEALGAEVSWDADTQTATAEKNGKTIAITIGSETMVCNGEERNLDVPVRLITNQTMLPLRAIAETLDCEVTWDEETAAVSITEDLEA